MERSFRIKSTMVADSRFSFSSSSSQRRASGVAASAVPFMGNVAISRPRTLTNGSGEKQAQARPCTPETEASRSQQHPVRGPREAEQVGKRQISLYRSGHAQVEQIRIPAQQMGAHGREGGGIPGQGTGNRIKTDLLRERGTVPQSAAFPQRQGKGRGAALPPSFLSKSRLCSKSWEITKKNGAPARPRPFMRRMVSSRVYIGGIYFIMCAP